MVMIDQTGESWSKLKTQAKNMGILDKRGRLGLCLNDGIMYHVIPAIK